MPAQSPPIVLDYDEGIDRKTLRTLTDRFLEVNRHRWQRARSALTHRQQAVLDLLPLIFHLNHPSLPGYADNDCPSGLAGYQPDEQTVHAARRVARTFRYRSDGRKKPDLDGLFLMGSPGSLGHSVTSDLDVWLCHRADLTEAQVQLLETKAARLSEWAGSLGVELHVFAFSAEDWRAGRQSAEVAGENCGSAQHYLLLDEFYRTSVHLGGACPLWWLVPADDELRYQECARQLLDCRFIRADEYIDFGPVPHVPEQEFLGAGIWQLYKGVETPWKSLLKLLLIECYARDQQGSLLSRQFKESVYAGQIDPDELDPYLLLYRRLEAWLSTEGAGGRLDLVRQSLYLKAGLPLTKLSETDGWRAGMLTRLVQEWGWSDRRLSWLDNRHLWRVEDVMVLRRSVVGELTHSYRLLSRLGREHGQGAAISGHDLNILGRKLYAAFQRKAGKLEQINPGLAPSLVEENLCFFRGEGAGDEERPDGWALFRDLERTADVVGRQAIRRSGNLTELLLWCYLNGLLTRATRLNIRANTAPVSVHELSALLDVLRQRLPVPLAPAPRSQLARAIRPLAFMLFVNIGIDPQSRLTELGLHRLSGYQGALGMGSGEENLVATIDQITLNSWHEVSLQHYASGDTLIQCLKNLLAAVATSPARLPELGVFCHTPGHGSLIARRLEGVVRDLLARFFAGGKGPGTLRYVIELSGRVYVLQFRGNEPGFVAFENGREFAEYLQRSPREFSPLVFDRYALAGTPWLKTVCELAEPDNIQVFFRERSDGLQLWVVDETGAIVSWQSQSRKRSTVLQPLSRFLENLQERRQLRAGAGISGSSVGYYELAEREQYWHAERRPAPDGRPPVRWMEVQAVGVLDPEARLQFDIYCDEREFTVQEYGDRLVPAVSEYIRSQRTSAEPYPVYLTDLHLPHDLDPSLYQQDIPTARYLACRVELEKALNR